MKRFLLAALLLAALLVPNTSQAYFGVGLGLVDEDNFGYGLVGGISLPMNLGLDFQLVGFVKDETAGAVDVNIYWIQGNADLSYDLNWLWKKVTEVVELHPYVKGGFTYGAGIFDTANIDSEASHGPGMNFGFGIDWKILPIITVGIDITESIIWLDGINVSGLQLGADQTAKVFNFLVTAKLFAY